MSKVALKKELESLSKEQLVNIILRTYSARKEFKEYYEFFLDPNIEKLTEKYQKEIIKESNRTKWGYSKLRVSKVRNMLKEYISFDPGAEYVLDLIFWTIRRLMVIFSFYRSTDTQLNAIAKLLAESLKYAEDNEMFIYWKDHAEKLPNLNLDNQSMLNSVSNCITNLIH
jgi:hypothetical protein